MNWLAMGLMTGAWLICLVGMIGAHRTARKWIKKYGEAMDLARRWELAFYRLREEEGE